MPVPVRTPRNSAKPITTRPRAILLRCIIDFIGAFFR
jgi:hypothetical protein